MTKFYMLVGLSANRNSTMAKEISEKEDVIIVSFDDVREKLLGDKTDKNKQGLVYDEMLRLTSSYLRNGFSVVYYAPNTNKRRRKALLSKLPKEVYKCCICLDADKETFVEKDTKRKGIIQKHIVDRMNSAMQIPTYNEGWHSIE